MKYHKLKKYIKWKKKNSNLNNQTNKKPNKTNIKQTQNENLKPNTPNPLTYFNNNRFMI